MKKIILFLLLSIAVYPQWDFGFGTTGGGAGGGTSRFSAVDLDGSTEYMYRNYAVADSFLNLNGYERIQNANSTGFESTVGTWLNKGNHAIDTVTANKIYGNKSGQIISSGAGDSLANFVCLVPSATSYHGVTATNKYTLEFWSKSLYCVAGDSIIVYHGGNRKAYACSTVAQKRVFNYEASTFTAGRDTIKIYTNNASGDTVLIDSVSFSQAYDYVLEGWIYQRSASAGTIFSNSVSLGSTSGKGIGLLYTSGSMYFYHYSLASGTGFELTMSSSPTLNQWTYYHIMVNRTGTTRAYINGVANGTSIASTGNANFTDSLIVGKKYAGFTQLVNAQIGEMRLTRFDKIESSTWTTATPLATYNAYTRGQGFTDGTTGGGKKISFWWDFGDGTSDALMLMDLSGNGYNLTGRAVTTADRINWKR